MASIASTSTRLSEPWRVSRCSIGAGYKQGRRGSSTSVSLPRRSGKPKGPQRRSGRLSLSSRNLPKEDPDTTAENFLFEKGIFETNPLSDITENGSITNPEAVEGKEQQYTQDPLGRSKGGLVPDEWKYIQHDLRMTKKEKKIQFKMQERENAQLNELRGELRRQRIDLLSEEEESAHAESLSGQTQLLTRSQLAELEKDLSFKAPDPRLPDKEFDEMFTFDEKGFLKRRIPDFSQIYSGKWPIVHMLASSGQYFFLDQFLELGVEVNEEDEDGYTPLQRAVQAKRETAVSQLLRAGANVDVYDKDGANLLHLSAQVHSLNLVKLFIRKGVQVNHADKYGWSPLHVAALTGKDDVVRHLVIGGADQTLRNKDGLTPLDIAIALGTGLNSSGVARTLRRLVNVDLRV